MHVTTSKGIILSHFLIRVISLEILMYKKRANRNNCTNKIKYIVHDIQKVDKSF